MSVPPHGSSTRKYFEFSPSNYAPSSRLLETRVGASIGTYILHEAAAVRACSASTTQKSAVLDYNASQPTTHFGLRSSSTVGTMSRALYGDATYLCPVSAGMNVRFNERLKEKSVWRLNPPRVGPFCKRTMENSWLPMLQVPSIAHEVPVASWTTSKGPIKGTILPKQSAIVDRSDSELSAFQLDKLPTTLSDNAQQATTKKVDHSLKGRRLDKKKVAILRQWAETHCRGALLLAFGEENDRLKADTEQLKDTAACLSRSGWTVELAKKINLSTRQVKEWVRRWRCKMFREKARELGIEIASDARLTRTQFLKLLETQQISSCKI